MAGDWIKIDTGLCHKPEVIHLAALLRIDLHAAVGKLIVFWSWADQHYDEREGASVTAAFIDDLTRCPNFAENLKKVGWLKGEDLRFLIPKFDRHNSESAKKRAQALRRMRAVRKRTESEQKANKPRTKSALEVEIEKEGEGTVPPPPVAEVIEFGARWPGEAASACPPGIPEDFCRRFHERTTERGEWSGPAGRPRNWRQQLAAWWRRDFRTWGQSRGGQKNGGATGAQKAGAREADVPAENLPVLV